MLRLRELLTVLVLAGAASSLQSAEKSPVQEALDHEIIGPRQTLLELQEYLEARIPHMPAVKTSAEWEAHARRIRAAVLDRVVFRGEAATWRKARCKVEWLETLAGGPGYRIKKARYEALPGLWIPALLYEPVTLKGKVPVCLAVNGHDRRKGKAADYKQIRCINLAKRGMLVLNVEWLGMGQLATPGFSHYRMNQLDLCGTSGLAPFYLAMSRGLDLLLALPNADPARVAVCGLSGGGWQTITLSSLDPRVTLANPVAGYSSLRTHLQHFKDLGDSEQAPTDLATVADYTHLTGLRAPRPTLLTYNARDDCCFEAGYALPPLLNAARPIFELYGKEKSLRSHINHDPGNHNYGKDNRQAFYRMVGDFFFPGDRTCRLTEIPSEAEVKGRLDLDVTLPEGNADFHTLALALSRTLPRAPAPPGDAPAAQKWQETQRNRLQQIVRSVDFTVAGARVGSKEKDGIKATFWKLKLVGSINKGPGGKVEPANNWTVPVVELVRGTPRETVILIADHGRRSVVRQAERQLKEGNRVLAVDLFYFGEAKIAQRDFLFALFMAAVGERPLGLQSSQLAAVARWTQAKFKSAPVAVIVSGERHAVIALIAAALEEKALGRLELRTPLISLKEIIDLDRSVDQMPELFCFGLLEAMDVKQLTALVAPRPVSFHNLRPRGKEELKDLKAWYKTLGRDFDPVR